MQGHFFPVTKLCMLGLSSTRNCYQLLSNIQMKWSQHYLILIKERGKHLKQQKAINVKFPVHFTDGPTKDWALSSPPSCNYVFRWRSCGSMNLLSWTLPASVGQTSGLLRTQKVPRHRDIDKICPLLPCKQAYNSTYLRSMLGPYLTLCNYYFITN